MKNEKEGYLLKILFDQGFTAGRGCGLLRTLTDLNGQIHSNLSVIVRNRPLGSVVMARSGKSS